MQKTREDLVPPGPRLSNTSSEELCVFVGPEREYREWECGEIRSKPVWKTVEKKNPLSDLTILIPSHCVFWNRQLLSAARSWWQTTTTCAGGAQVSV